MERNEYEKDQLYRWYSDDNKNYWGTQNKDKTNSEDSGWEGNENEADQMRIWKEENDFSETSHWSAGNLFNERKVTSPKRMEKIDEGQRSASICRICKLLPKIHF